MDFLPSHNFEYLGHDLDREGSLLAIIQFSHNLAIDHNHSL